MLESKENTEKKEEQEKTEMETNAQKEVAAQQETQAKTEELTRKKVDKIKKDAETKTAAAEKEANTLKDTLMKFMQHAHDRLFSKDAQEKQKADEEAAAIKSEKEKAQDALHQAKLAQAVADTEASAASEKLKGIMAKISEGSSDHTVLQKLSQEAESVKGAVLNGRAKATAAAKAVAEKQQAMLKFTVKADAEEKKAEEEDKKVAEEEEAEKKEEEQAPAAPDATARR